MQLTWIQLFFTFFKIGFLAIGGAYSFLPLFEEELLENHQWITRDEFLEVLGVVQLFPGAISIKFATYTGYKLLGIPGVIIANLGNLLPPALIILGVSSIFTKYQDHQLFKDAFAVIKLAVITMIISVALKMLDLKTIVQPKPAMIMTGSFVLFYFLDVHPAVVILFAGLIGILLK